ncbi:hypothetical protein K8R03_01320 [Candidatus Kaiserbacteria bacterium]|nr:hypothetical protein [Candidatus Kaiserbacteria bacterium]
MSGVIAGLIAGIHAFIALFVGAPAQAPTMQGFDDGQTPAQIVQQVINPLPVQPAQQANPPVTDIGGISVSGMSKYTDSDFGFSFWYPSGWTVNSPKGEESGIGGNLEDCTLKKSLSIHGTQISNGVSIGEYHCPNLSMTLRGANGTNPVGMDVKYYFDRTAHTWMVSDLSDPPNGSPRTTAPVDVSNNTMGGLHIFAGAARFGADVVIPLSARNFLIVSTNDGGGYVDERLFAKTIVALDPAVATPVSDSEQTATIQAEAAAYGVNVPAPAPAGNVYTSSQYPLTFTYPSDFVPAENITPTQKNSTISYMPVSCADSAICSYYVGPSIDAVEAASFSVQSSAGPTYEDCTAKQGKTIQKTINGTTWYTDSTGDAGLGHRLSTQTYRTYFNGACYEAYLSIAWNVGQGAGPDQAQFNALQGKLDSMMSSVRFTTTETLPRVHAGAVPAWKTLSNTQIPISFTYPGAFLSYDSDAELSVGPGTRVGLQTQQSSIDAGSINVQKGYIGKSPSVASAMQASMNTDPIAYPGYTYTAISLGGEPAFMASHGDSTVIYVAHDSDFYRIILWLPLLPGEYQTFLNSFTFTS